MYNGAVIVRLECALIFALLALLAAGCGRGPSSLPPGEALPYELVLAVPTATYPGWVVTADFDGDGVDEEIKYDAGTGGASFLSVARVGTDQLYSLDTINMMSKGGICGLVETTGDRAPELLWWWQTSRESVSVFVSGVAVDQASAELSELHALRVGTEGNLLPDGQWGGDIFLIGSFELDGEPGLDALAIGVSAGITYDPREIRLWNIRSGEIEWRLPTGATPTGGRATADIDGDGEQELLVCLEAPGNRVTAGDWDDLHSYVVAVDLDGAVRWWHRLGGYSSDVDVATADLDGDGTAEVVTGLSYHSEADVGGPEISVWNGPDGALLDTLRAGCPVNIVETIECSEGPRVFAGASDGRLIRLRWRNGALEQERVLHCGDAVEVIAPAALAPVFDETRVVVGMGKGGIAVVDEWLRPLAASRVDGNIEGFNRVWQTALPADNGAVTGVLVRTANNTYRLKVVRKPVPLRLRVLLPLLAVAAVGAAVPRTRRASIARLRRWLLPKQSRDESIEELLSALATAGHGKLAVTSTLRRLHRQCSAIGSGDVSETFENRLLDAVRNLADVGLPGLEEIHRLSERVGTAPADTARLASDVKAIRSIVAGLPEGLPAPAEAAALEKRLEEALAGVDAALQRIKSAAERERSSSLGLELERALSARRQEIEEMGVELEAPSPGALKSARVVGTSRELSFVLDNLIGNAIAAMRGQSERRLRVSAEFGGGKVALRFEDSGNGIPACRREQIFAPGVSDREGGGHGLAASREMLGARGGAVELVESAPGRGAVFEVRLRLWQE